MADLPTSNPRLGFENYADAIAAGIRGGQPPRFTVGIYGPWGSGKSSLLNAIEARLARDDDVVSVMFDAWRFQQSEHIILPLLHSIYSSGIRRKDEALASILKRALLSVAFSFNFKVGPIGLDASKIRDNADKLRADPIKEFDVAFERPYLDMLEISEELNGRRIVVLIDDLDRCSPAKVVDVLEAINLVMDVPGFIFVLALDYDVLVSAVNQKYPHTSGHTFIEKMVQVPFRVPALELREDSFLADLVPEWAIIAESLDSRFAAGAHFIATHALGANPRQIKRFLNALLVTSRVAKSAKVSFDHETLAGVVGLQLRWPDWYLEFANSIRSGDPQPATVLLESDDPVVKRYANRFFLEITSAMSLRRLISLTEAIAGAESAPPVSIEVLSDDHDRLLEERKELFLHQRILEGSLSRLGFTASSVGGGTSYRHGELEGFRFYFDGLSVTAESRDGLVWKSVGSFKLSSEAKELARLLDGGMEKIRNHYGLSA